MRRWKPKPSFGRWVALLLLIGALGGAALFGARLARALRGAPETWTVDLALYADLLGFLLLLVIAGALLYRLGSALTLSYELDRNGLYVTWLGNRAVVPLDRIQNIDVGVADATLPAYHGLVYVHGRGRTADGRTLHLFATQPPERCLTVYTAQDAYTISPADAEAFVQDLEQRRNLGATKAMPAVIESSRMFLYAFWNDRTVRVLLLIAVALNLIVFGVLAARYGALDTMVQMRFDATGQAADLRPRHQVLFLPLAAFGLSLLNVVLGLLFYKRQQLGARLLQGASVVVQILFGIATFTIIR